MPHIVIVDTSVLLNVLDIPRRNEQRHAVLNEFTQLVDAGANLLLPMGAVFEAGSHISRLDDGRQRRYFAEQLRDRVREALAGQAPWAPLQLPDARQLGEWLDNFPESAMQELSLVDHSIIKAWNRTIAQNPNSRVRIWSLDRHLAGYDHQP